MTFRNRNVSLKGVGGGGVCKEALSYCSCRNYPGLLAVQGGGGGCCLTLQKEGAEHGGTPGHAPLTGSS